MYRIMSIITRLRIRIVGPILGVRLRWIKLCLLRRLWVGWKLREICLVRLQRRGGIGISQKISMKVNQLRKCEEQLWSTSGKFKKWKPLNLKYGKSLTKTRKTSKTPKCRWLFRPWLRSWKNRGKYWQKYTSYGDILNNNHFLYIFLCVRLFYDRILLLKILFKKKGWGK